MKSEKPNRIFFKINYKTQFSINPILKDEIEKKSIKKMT